MMSRRMPLKAPTPMAAMNFLSTPCRGAVQAGAAPDHAVRPEQVDDVETVSVDDFGDAGRWSWCPVRRLPPFLQTGGLFSCTST
jgi:hypothetical protein